MVALSEIEELPVSTGPPLAGGPIAELRNCHEQFHALIEELVAQVESLATEVGRRETVQRTQRDQIDAHAAELREWRERASAAEAERDERAAALSSRQAELVAAHDETARLRDELTETGSKRQELDRQWAQSEKERAKLDQDLGGLRAELAASQEHLQVRQNELVQQSQLAAERAHEATELREQLAASVGQAAALQQQHDAANDELTGLRGEVETLRAQLRDIAPVDTTEWERKLVEADLQCRQTSAELEQAQQQAVHLASVEPELVSARGELEQQRGELAAAQTAAQRATDELGQVRAELADAQSAARKARESLRNAGGAEDDLRRQLAESELEGRAMESELETLRMRAAELQETLEERKRQLSDERTEWNNELRQLRRLLERQADLLTQHSHAPSADDTVPAQRPAVRTERVAGQGRSSGGGRPRDGVVSAVMAQFEMLQKERVRKNGKSQ